MGRSPDLVLPTNREFVGGDLLAQTLKHFQVNVAFGLHGGHLDAFLMGASDSGIRLVDTRHEATAVRAAEGYSKIKHELGVCFFTANSGFANALAGLATASADRSAILCITSSSPMRDVDMNVLQGQHDQVVVARPVTKYAQRVTCPEEIPRLVSYAVRQATSGIPGPVLLDFPIEVLFSPVQPGRIAWGSVGAPLPHPPGPSPDAISEAVQLIIKAQRPVIVTSTGGRFLKADASFERFVQQTQIPVFHSGKYSGPLPWNHTLRGGPASRLAALANLDKPQPDLVILAGCRTGMYMGSRSSPSTPHPSAECRYIQIDTDGGEIGRGIYVDVGITSDVRPAFAALDAAVRQIGYAAPPDWVTAATSLRKLPFAQEKEAAVAENGRIHPYYAVKTSLQALEPGSIVCIDGGECSLWASQLAESAQPETYTQSTGYLGFLGNGWGYALGAAIADPSRTVVNVQGDGSAGFHLTEVDSYVRHNCRVLTIVYNNYCWGMSNAGQELIYGREIQARPASALSPVMDFTKVAEGMGAAAAKVSRLEDIADAVRRLEGTGKAALLEILTNDRPIHPGTIGAVGMTDDPSVVVVPYYDNVPRGL